MKSLLLDLDDTLLDYSGGVEECWSAACSVGCSGGAVSLEALVPAVAASRRWFWDDPTRHRRERVNMPGAWTKIKIQVRGEQARLYVHDNEQPTLIVKDLKSGANGHGGVALWLEPGTVAHFRNLTVEPSTR